MLNSPLSASARIRLVEALPEHEPILANLLELYSHDFSEFHFLDLNAEGRFGYQQLPLYWSEPDRHPFLVTVDDKLAGLAFVKRGSQLTGDRNCWDMAEFFVVRAYRKRGVGTQAAHRVLRSFPGRWEVRVMESNQAALAFWMKAIRDFAGEAVVPVRMIEHGEPRHLFRFDVPYACTK